MHVIIAPNHLVIVTEEIDHRVDLVGEMIGLILGCGQNHLEVVDQSSEEEKSLILLILHFPHQGINCILVVTLMYNTLSNKCICNFSDPAVVRVHQVTPHAVGQEVDLIP